MRIRLILVCALGMVLCGPVPAAEKQAAAPFKVQVISEKAEMWWARVLADINKDGLLDIALQNNNARGGWLGWLETQGDMKGWKQHIIAKTAPDGGTFASMAGLFWSRGCTMPIC